MKFTQIRHGSHIIEYKNKKFLVDPVFGDKESTAQLPMGKFKMKNPMVALPMNLDFIKEIDALLITHMHFDHFDQPAMDALRKDIKIFCSPVDEKKIKEAGFTNVRPINGHIVFDGIKITTTSGKHGTGLAGFLMGHVAGYILEDVNNAEPTTYLIGDSLWYDHIHDNIKKYNPKAIIVFAGEARLMGRQITMSTGDIDAILKHTRDAQIIVNHMETWNHCYLTRDALKQHLSTSPSKDRVFIPNDGESKVI